MIEINISNIKYAAAIPFVGASGYLVGHIYGKLADLPAAHCAKAWAIWNVATQSFHILTSICIAEKPRKLLNAGYGIGSSVLFIKEMTKKELMGDKMKIFLQALLVIQVAYLSYLSLTYNQSEANPVEP